VARKRKPPRAELEQVKARVEKKIKRASEFDPNQNFLIYGPPDSFKTRTAATAPKVLVVDCDEKGTDSVRRDIDPYVVPVEFWSEINEIYWYAQSGDHDYESFALDGLTGLQTLAMNFVLGDEAARDASRDPDMPSRAIWQKVGQLMKTQITNWRNLPYNTIFTALSRTRDVGEGGEEDDPVWHTGPNVSPSVAGHLEAAVGTIGYMMNRQVVVKSKNPTTNKIRRRKEVRRRMLVGPQERYTTKDRNGLFGEYLDAPDLAEMLTMIQGKKEA
jgi:hypothetical protein